MPKVLRIAIISLADLQVVDNCNKCPYSEMLTMSTADTEYNGEMQTEIHCRKLHRVIYTYWGHLFEEGEIPEDCPYIMSEEV